MASVYSSKVPEAIDATVAHLAAARGDGRELASALVGLVRVHLWLEATAAELVDLRARASEHLEALTDEVDGFVGDLMYDAEGAMDELSWRNACSDRSALQLLLDEYGETAAARAIGTDDLTEIDRLMRQSGDVAGPIEDASLPPTIPAGHWWWSYPED